MCLRTFVLMQQHANIAADGHHRLEGAGLNVDSTREVSSVETQRWRHSHSLEGRFGFSEVWADT